jgi:hypothetical protein
MLPDHDACQVAVIFIWPVYSLSWCLVRGAYTWPTVGWLYCRRLKPENH